MRSALFLIMVGGFDSSPAPLPKTETVAIKTHPDTTFDEINDEIKKIAAEIIAQGDFYISEKSRTKKYKTALKLASKQLRQNSISTDRQSFENQID